MTKFSSQFYEILAIIGKIGHINSRSLSPNSAIDFFILIFLKIKVQVIYSIQNFSQIYQVVLKKKLILVV